MNVPQHIAIILDGNGRWAKAKGMPRNYGHAQGSKNVEKICEEAWRMGIKYLTVYAFSTENWSRPENEVAALMKLLRNYMKTCLKTAAKNDMKIRVIGDIEPLDDDIKSRIRELEAATTDNGGLNFTIALNYGSRDELTRAAQKMAKDCAEGKIKAEEIDESVFETYLDTHGIPDPDMMIRTSGEQRLSNYLLWQLAYSEFMFKTRLLSGIMLMIIALTTVIAGGQVLFTVLFAISLIGMSELYKVFGIEKKAPGIVGYIFAFGYYALIYMEEYLPGEKHTWFMLLFMAYLICQMAVLVFSYPKYNTQQIMAAFFGVFYVAVMRSYIYLTRMLPGGVFTVWLVFICSWGCDTCAYCVGMLIGKHKMASVLSPKKSVEGGIGGIAGAALIGVLYALAVNHWGNAGASIVSYAVIGAVGGAISQIGDLAASAIKRYHNIKDYGKLIPGHGGILDRFDSVIFTAPIIYYLAVLL